MDSIHTIFPHHVSETPPPDPTSPPHQHQASSFQLPPPTHLVILTHLHSPLIDVMQPSNLWKNDLPDALQEPMDKKVTRTPCKSTYGKKTAHTPMEKGMEREKLSIDFSIGDQTDTAIYIYIYIYECTNVYTNDI